MSDKQEAAPAASASKRWPWLAAIGGIAVVAVVIIVALAVHLGSADAAAAHGASLEQQIRSISGQLAGLKAQQGEAAKTAANAAQAHLGVCVSSGYDSNTGDLSYTSVTSPVLTHGVASCPSGSFVPVTPQPPTALSGQG